MNLLSFCWKFATLFDAVSANKACHIWVIMFTYLGLVAAWVYYRNRAHNDENDAATERNKSEDEREDRIEHSDAESDLANILSTENEVIFDDDCFKQVPIFEQETQIDHITAVGNASNMPPTKEDYGGFDSHGPFDPSGINKDRSVLNPEGNLCLNTKPEEFRTRDHVSHLVENSVSGNSQERYDGEPTVIQHSEYDDVSIRSMYDPDSSPDSNQISEENQRWNEYEQAIEIGFLPFNVSNENDVYKGYGEIDIRKKGLSAISKNTIPVIKFFDPVQNISDTEIPLENVAQEISLLPVCKGRTESLDNASEVKLVGKACSKGAKGEASSCSSSELSEIDLKIHGNQIGNPNQLKSMIDSVEMYDFPCPTSESSANAYLRKEEVIEREILPNEVPHEYYEASSFNSREIDDLLLPNHLEKFENVKCGFTDSERCTIESEDNVSANDKLNAGLEAKDDDVVQNAIIKFPVKAYRDGSNNARATDFIANDNTAPAAVDGKYMSRVNESACKQLARITNAADNRERIDLQDEDGNVNENEAEDMFDEECDISDGYSETYGGIIDDISELIEGESNVTNLQSESSDYFGELYGERIGIEDSLNVVICQSQVKDNLREINDARYTDSTVAFCDASGEFNQLPSNTCLGTDALSKPTDGYNESSNEPSDLGEDLNETLETMGVVTDISEVNLRDTMKFEVALDEIINITLEEKIDGSPEKATLTGTCDEELIRDHTLLKNITRGNSVDEFQGNFEKDEEYKSNDTLEERYSAEEKQRYYWDGKVCRGKDAEDCNKVEKFDCGYKEQDYLTKEVFIESSDDSAGAHTTEKKSITSDENKYNKVDVGMSRNPLNSEISLQTTVSGSEWAYPQQEICRNDFCATHDESGVDFDNAVLKTSSYEKLTNSSDNKWGTRTENTHELGKSMEDFSGVQIFDKDSENYCSQGYDVEVKYKECFSRGDQDRILSEEESSVPTFCNNDSAFSDEEMMNQEVDQMERCSSGSEDETGDSTASTGDFDYELLVSSGAESGEDSDENKSYDWICRSEEGTRDDITNGTFDIRTSITVLDTIDEMEEIGIDGVINTNTNATAKEGICRAVVPRDHERLNWTELLNKERNYHIQINRREIPLAFSCYPENAGFVRYLGNVLLNPDVFVDVFNNIPFQLFCRADNANRTPELNTKELNSRSHLGLLVANRDANLAKEICKIAGDIDSYFSSFKKESEHRQGCVVLPGCFGISFAEKAHYDEFKELTPIVCESNPTLDADALHFDGHNAFSYKVVHPAINFEDSNICDSGQILKDKPTQTLQFNSNVNEQIPLTTLAAVGDEKCSESGSSLGNSSKCLEREGTAFLELDDLNTGSKSLGFPTDSTRKECHLKRTREFDETVRKKRPRSSLESVSQPIFDTPFEQTYEFSGNEHSQGFCEFSNAIVDFESGTNQCKARQLNFDLLLSNTQPLADFVSEDFIARKCETELHSTEKPEDFEGRNRAVEVDPTCEGMGQAQSVVFTKGTLAMPVSSYYLRGVSVRNQGDYAVINYKNTRFAPLISVDKRIEITMTVPKQNAILPDKKVDPGKCEAKKSNELSAKRESSANANSSISTEIVSEFISAIDGGNVNKSMDSFVRTDVETMPTNDSSVTFSIRRDKMAEIAQKFGETILQQESESRGKENSSDDKGSEKLMITIYDEKDSVLDPTGENFAKSGYSEGRIDEKDLNKVLQELAFVVEKHEITNESVSPKHSPNEITCDVRVAARDSDLKGHFVYELDKSATDDTCDNHGLESTANDSYFEGPVVTSSNNDVQNAVKICCFGDFGVTNPDTDDEQIQSMNNNDFQVAVNGHGELSVSNSQHEVLAYHDDKVVDGKEKGLPQDFEFDHFQTEVKIKLVDTEAEVREDNENSLENECTIGAITVPKYKRVRSKSLTSLPEGLFENMSWFYRDRPSSVCFDDDNLKQRSYGALRRTKSAEVSRRKPKIRMSTNFERRPIKETNLDELIKSLEYLGPRKKEIVNDGETIPKAVAENVKEEITNNENTINRNAQLPSEDKYGRGNQKGPVENSFDVLDSPSTTFRKIVVETKRVVKQEPQLSSTMSANIDENSKYLHEANKVMGSVDKNNNSNVRQDQKNKTFSSESGDKAASLGAAELRNASFLTNGQDVLTKHCSSEQQVSTKEELHATLSTNLKDKASKLGTIECSLEEKPPTIYNEQKRSNAISEIIQQLTSNATEDKTYSLNDCTERVSSQTVVKNVDQKQPELNSVRNEEENKRKSTYGFSVFLSESHQFGDTDFDAACESDVDTTLSPKKEHFWMHQRTGSDGDGNCTNEKVSDIDLVLKSKFPASLDQLEGLDDSASNAPCNSCGNALECNFNSTTDNCDYCKEKGDLQKQKSHEKPRSRNSFRKDRRLRKWLEDRQSSMNSEDKVILDIMDVDDQSRLLRKVALSKGIDYADHEEEAIKKKRHSSLRSRQFDFLEQLRYLINFEDDDYDERIRNLEVSEKENDAIELLREYEACRQLKKGKSPMVSDDEGNDSDAFTDITDTTFSDYVKSRQSLNSLFLSQGSLYRSGNLVEEYDHIHDSFGKELSTDLNDGGVSNSTPREESYFQRSTPLEKETKYERNTPIRANFEKSLHEVSISNLSHHPETNENVEKAIAAELFSIDDVSGLISQGNSAVRNRRGRAPKHNVPLPVLNVGNNAGTELGSQPWRTPVDLSIDDVFVENSETKVLATSAVDSSKRLLVYGGISRKNLTEQCIYADSPCSLLTERLNDASYENLRTKLLHKHDSASNSSWPHEGNELHNRSSYSDYNIRTLGSPLIQVLNDSPRQKQRASSLRQVSADHRTPSPRNRSLHSVPTSPPRLVRELPFRKSTGSYNQRKKECRSLPDLVVKPESGFASPVKSRCSSGASSTLSLQYRSPRLPVSSPPRSARRSPFRSPLRSPRLSDLEDEIADTETVFSDHTAFFSDSSIDIGMTQDGYEVDDEDFFLPNSMLGRNLSQNFDDFLTHDSDGASSGEYFVPLNIQSKRPESRIISCAFGPCNNKDFVDWSQRSQFTSCASCFTYYCSKECRRAHWNEHKITCHYGRINYYTKALVRRFETNEEVNEKLSRLALEGFHDNGRGCVLITFSSPMAAKFFLVSGTNAFVKDPGYASLNDVMNEGIVTKHQVLLQQTLHDYNPEIEFVANLTVFAGKQNEIQASTRSRFKSRALLRCAKIPLNNIFLNRELDPYPETSYDIKVFYLPRSKNHHFINDTEARRYYCREVSYGLRKYGIILKRDYPEAYDKLCLYVEHDVEFVPITLYGQTDGSNYKCIVFPEGFSGSNSGLELQGRGMLV